MFNQLIELFMRFPGIGPRQARRFVYFLAGENSDYVKNLGEMIISLKKQSGQCASCFRFFASSNLAVEPLGSLSGSTAKLCPICANSDRDSSLLMVVEKDVDLENIEKNWSV